MSLEFFNQGVGLLIKKNLWEFEFGIFLGDGERSWLEVWEGQLFKLVFDKFWSIGQNV